MALALVLVLSGCFTVGPSGPPVSARGIGPDTPSDAGPGGFTLTVQVLAEPGGPPLGGAGVVAYWGDDAPASWDFESDRPGARVEVEGGSGGGSVVTEVGIAAPGTSPRTPRDLEVLRLRTDSQGLAVARVPADRVVGVVAAAQGWTEEWVPALASGASGGRDTMVLPLYRSQLNLTWDDAWGPAGASPARVTGDDHEWRPDAVAFAANPEAQRGYLARLAGLRATLTWTNGLDGVGDLGLGVGPTGADPVFVQDTREELTPGAHEDAFALGRSEVEDLGLRGAADLRVGPLTSTAYAGPLGGLPYTVALDADFETAVLPRTSGFGADASAGGGSGTPGFEAALALPALAGVALLGARRRA